MIEFENLSKRYDTGYEALSDVSCLLYTSDAADE